MKKSSCLFVLSTLAILVLSSSVSFAQVLDVPKVMGVQDVTGTYTVKMRVKFSNTWYFEAPCKSSFTENGSMAISQSGEFVQIIMSGLDNPLIANPAIVFFAGTGQVGCGHLTAIDCVTSGAGWSSQIVAHKVTDKKIKGTWMIVDQRIGAYDSGLVIKFTAKKISSSDPVISTCTIPTP